MKKAFMAVVLFAAQVLMFDVVPTQAASAPTLPDLDVQLMRADLRSQKKQIVAQNMLLTDTEAEKFWPVYDQYAAETIKINDARFEFIKQYAERYDSMTDADAQVLIKKWLEADAAAVQLRLKYIPTFEKVLPAKKVARFMQIDRRLGLLLDTQIASQIPLMAK